MANDSLTGCHRAFNQSSASSDAAFQLSECLEQLEQSLLLMARAEALTAAADGSGLDTLSPSQKHHYFSTLDELIVSARDQVSDVITKLRCND